jgi:hypothetical protein
LEWLGFLAVRVFVILLFLLNVAMLALNLFLQLYRNAIISGTVAAMLALVFVHNQSLIRKHRRKARTRAQKMLDECYRFRICPDCGQLSLDANLICQRVECGSQFHRSRDGRWIRVDERPCSSSS